MQNTENIANWFWMFDKFFASGGEAWKKIIGGLKKFFLALVKGVIAMVPIIVKGLAGLLGKITDWLKQPSSSSGMGTAIKESLVKDLSPQSWEFTPQNSETFLFKNEELRVHSFI